MSDPILTIKDVADYLKVNERTIYRLMYRIFSSNQLK